MKQVQVDSKIKTLLQNAVGADADISRLAVFEVSALSTAPIRKKHALYVDGRHTRQFLEDMAAALNAESLPLQIMHEMDPLPVGRVFHAEVLTSTLGSELRTLMWVDGEHQDLISKINSGTIDQVSVQVLPKEIKCSSCGFNFLGEDSTYENIWSGTCDKGHTMGVDGSHAVMDRLDAWHELSLVGKGGIKGARILSSTDRRLAANGSDLTPLVLSILTEPEKQAMDLKEIIEQLAAKTVGLAQVTVEKDAALAANVELTAKLAAADAKVVEMTASLTAAEGEVAPGKAALAVLKGTAQILLTRTGDVTTKLDDKTVDDLKAVIEERSQALTLTSVSAAPLLTASDAPAQNSAFRRAPR